MHLSTRSYLALTLVLAACEGESGVTEQAVSLYETVVQRKPFEAGGGTAQRLRFGPGDNVELEIPADVAPTRLRGEVSLVTGTIRRGQHPVNDAGLLVEPPGLRFAVPVRVRQPVPPPPLGKTYVAVVIPDGETAFVARTPGRRVSGPDPALGGLEIWEGEGDGSGLWGFAEVDERN